MWNRLPILAFFLILAALGSAAVPGLNGFVGEFPILAGMFQTSARTAVLAATGMVLGACYLLWMLRTVVFGPLREPAHAGGRRRIAGRSRAGATTMIAPIGWHEIAGMTPLLVLIVLIGVFPRPFLNQIRPAVAPHRRRTCRPSLPRATEDRQAAAQRPRSTAEAARRRSAASRTAGEKSPEHRWPTQEQRRKQPRKLPIITGSSCRQRIKKEEKRP